MFDDSLNIMSETKFTKTTFNLKVNLFFQVGFTST